MTIRALTRYEGDQPARDLGADDVHQPVLGGRMRERGRGSARQGRRVELRGRTARTGRRVVGIDGRLLLQLGEMERPDTSGRERTG